MKRFIQFIASVAIISYLASNCNAKQNEVQQRTPNLDSDFLHYEYEGVMFHYRINAQQTFAYLQDLDNWGGGYNAERIVVPDSLPYNGKNYPVQVIEYATFRGATKLKELVLPATVISLGTNWNMTPEIWPFMIISDYTDYCHCPNLEKITIAEENPVMKDIDGVVYSKDGSILYYHPPKNSETYVIPEGVTPANYAFACNGILKQVDIQNELNSIPASMFTKCDNLKHVNLPASLKIVGVEAFKECSALEKIDLPAGLEEIHDYAFQNCTALKQIDMPYALNTIKRGAFYECSQLSLINLNEDLKIIGGEAFFRTILPSLYIPISVQVIGWNSLAIDNSDFELYISAPDPDMIEFLGNSSPFRNGPQRNWVLYVPEGSKELYEDYIYWEDFRKIKEWDPSFVSSIETDDIIVYTEKKTIKIKGINKTSMISVYKLDGRCVWNGILSSDTSLDFIYLDKGIYFVKIKNKTWKILL